MNDNLIYGIFKELAVLEGLRTPEGAWKEADKTVIRKLLRQEVIMVRDLETVGTRKDSSDEA